ncbi:reverse transcriptase domain-containing protein [Tanacetum coccineum]
MCINENHNVNLNDLIESEREWSGPTYLDTTDSGKKEETKAYTFYRMGSEEVWGRYITPCFMEGLDAFDGVTDLECEKNLISNEFVVKLDLTYEVMKNRDKVMDRMLLVLIKGELYFVDFIVNPEEDNVEPYVIFVRSFLKLAKAIINFRSGILTIWPETNTIDSDDDELDALCDTRDLSSSLYRCHCIVMISILVTPRVSALAGCDTLLASINIDELPPIDITDFPTFVCNMGKSLRNKKNPTKTYKMTYDGEGPSLTVNRPKTQEELTRDELKEDLYEIIMLLNEKRLIIETLKYCDKHKMFLDSVLLDKLKLDGKLDFHALVDTGSNRNMMPYRIYELLDREKVKTRIVKVRMLDHSNAETMGRLLNVLCQVGVTTVLANFMLLDVSVDRDVPIIVGRSFMYNCGAIMSTL